jgi:hypothetical protein
MDKNTLLQLVSQIGTGPVAQVILDSGHTSLDSYLAASEPKQPVSQVPLGSGDGTTASEVEHYIDMGCIDPSLAGNMTVMRPLPRP